MSKLEIINILREKKIFDLFQKNNISHLYLFWSYAHGQEKVESDIDLLFEVEEEKKFSLFNIWNLKYNLENLLWKEVDLVDKRSIKKEIKDNIMNDLILIF